MSKENIGTLIIVIDLIVILSTVVYSQLLHNSLTIYTNQFKDQTIEMSDFTISLGNLPLEHKYGNNEDVLRVFLIKHFESIVKNEMKKSGQLHMFDSPEDNENKDD